VGPLTADDDDLMVRCEITYTADSANNFNGGVVTSDTLTLKLASVTSFTVSSDSITNGDTITLTCVATGETVPTFTFYTRGSAFDASKYTFVSGPTVETSGTTFTAEYVTTTKQATVIQGGQKAYCEVNPHLL